MLKRAPGYYIVSVYVCVSLAAMQLSTLLGKLRPLRGLRRARSSPSRSRPRFRP